jgi:putative ABC transport system permease protein
LINKLVIENLKHRPVRTLLSICAISLEVTMILTLVGVSRGMLEDVKERSRGVGADIWIRPSGSSLMTFSNASMPEKLVDFFASQPNVELAVGAVSYGAGVGESTSGVDLDKFAKMSPFRFVEGGMIRDQDDILVDQRYAEQKKLRAGSKIELWNRTWEVSGIYESGKLARIILPKETVQELSGASGRVSQIFLKLDDPKNAEMVKNRLKSNPALQGYPIYTIEEWTSLWSVNTVPGLQPFIAVIVTLGVVVGFLVVFLSMYTAVLERTREIGILKSLGASSAYILGILLRETAVLAVIGAALGIVVTYGARWAVNTYAGPALTQMIVVDWWPITGAIAISGAMLGTLYPAVKAVRQDALEALSYE